MWGKSENIFVKPFFIVLLVVGFLVFTLPLLRLIPLPFIDTSDLFYSVANALPLALIMLMGILLLYIVIMFILKGPSIFFESKSTGKPPANTTLTCKHGHTVPVWFNYDGQYIYSGPSYFSDRVSKANIWPKRCPICGAHWRIPELEND